MKIIYLLIVILLPLYLSGAVYSQAEFTSEVKIPVSAANEENDNIGVTSPVHFPSVTKLLESTGIVIGVIIIIVYLLRKKMGIKTGLGKRKRYLNVIESASLGAKRSIHMVKVPGKLLIIGASRDQICSLASITEKEIVDSVDTEYQSSDFMSFFKRVDTDRK